MKLYSIKKGERVLVITGTELATGLGSRNSGSVVKYDTGRVFNTTRDLSFTETVIDPIKIHNSLANQLGHPKIFNDLAKVGYALFRSEDKPLYILAVEYKHVEVV
jgi:hypothetical protein